MLQGWLFYSLSTFWTNDAIKAFLGGVPNQDIIILDLFSESQPQMATRILRAFTILLLRVTQNVNRMVGVRGLRTWFWYYVASPRDI